MICKIKSRLAAIHRTTNQSRVVRQLIVLFSGGEVAKPFSAAAAKRKWQALEKSINQLALNKQAVASMEREMERSGTHKLSDRL